MNANRLPSDSAAGLPPEERAPSGRHFYFFRPRTDVLSALGIRWDGIHLDTVKNRTVPLQSATVSEVLAGTGTTVDYDAFPDEGEGAFVVYTQYELPIYFNPEVLLVLGERMLPTKEPQPPVWLVKKIDMRVRTEYCWSRRTKGYALEDLQPALQLLVAENRPLSYTDILNRLKGNH